MVFVIGIVFGLGAGFNFNNWPINIVFLQDPLFQFIIGNVWLYSLIVSWSFRQVQRTNLSFSQIIGKLPKNSQWLRSICLVVPILMFSLGCGFLSLYLLTFFAPNVVESTIGNKLFLSASETAFPFTYNVLQIFSLVIVAPVVEEIFFRGLILQRWSVKWGITPGIILSSLFFGILHPANPVGLSMFGSAIYQPAYFNHPDHLPYSQQCYSGGTGTFDITTNKTDCLDNRVHSHLLVAGNSIYCLSCTLVNLVSQKKLAQC